MSDGCISIKVQFTFVSYSLCLVMNFEKRNQGVGGIKVPVMLLSLTQTSQMAHFPQLTFSACSLLFNGSLLNIIVSRNITVLPTRL